MGLVNCAPPASLTCQRHQTEVPGGSEPDWRISQVHSTFTSAAGVNCREGLGFHGTAGQLVDAILEHHRGDIGAGLELGLEKDAFREGEAGLVADDLDGRLGMDRCDQAPQKQEEQDKDNEAFF